MNPEMQRLEQLLQTKIEEGLFTSMEQAIETIERWLEELDTNLTYEAMRNQDA